MSFLKVKLTQRKTICSFLKIIWIAGAWLQKLDGGRSKWKGVCYGDRNIWDGKQHNVGINVYITDISILFQYSFPVIHRDSEAVLKAKKNFVYIKNIYISSTEINISFVISVLPSRHTVSFQRRVIDVETTSCVCCLWEYIFKWKPFNIQ